MNDLSDKELSALFARDSEALVDEAFVQRCVASIRRAERWVLALKLIVACAAVGIVALLSSLLNDLAATVQDSLFAGLAFLDGLMAGLGRATVVGAVLALIVWRYGFSPFRPRERRR